MKRFEVTFSYTIYIEAESWDEAYETAVEIPIDVPIASVVWNDGKKYYLEIDVVGMR